MFHVLLSCVLNVVVIDCCLTLLYCAFQPVVALINHLLTYLLTYLLTRLLPWGMTEDHVRWEDKRCTSQRLLLHGFHAGVVDVTVGSDLRGSDGTEVRGASVQRLQVTICRLLLLLLRLALALIAPDLRARPALQRCSHILSTVTDN